MTEHALVLSETALSEEDVTANSAPGATIRAPLSHCGKVERLFAGLGKPSDAIRIDNFTARWLSARMATLDRTQQMMELEGWKASPQQ